MIKANNDIEKPAKKEFNCPTPNCWEHVSKRGSLCPACRSWWHRVQLKTADELGVYYQRMGRFAGRLKAPTFLALRRPRVLSHEHAHHRKSA